MAKRVSPELHDRPRSQTRSSSASIKTLNAKNLELLSASRLAALLIEVTRGNAVAQRRLRLELAGNAGPEEAARAIGKRLTAIARSRTHVDWRKVKPLVTELGAQHAAIMEQVAPTDPRGAFQLLWRLVSCADSVFARSDDGSGRLPAVFRDAVRQLGPLAQAADLDPTSLAEQAFEAVTDNGYGQWDDLVGILAPALGTAGLGDLRDRVTAWQAEPHDIIPAGERQIMAWSGKGPIYADEIAADSRRRTAAHVLQQIADLRGDVNGYIAQVPETARQAPVIAAGIARRLLDAGRVAEAWAAVEVVDNRDRAAASFEWEQARIDVLDMLGRADVAQAFRWERFAATLNTAHLRAHLRKLPDFDDVDAEHRAMTLAVDHPDFNRALAFLIAWPSLGHAARLVLARADELDGDRCELLGPAADTLAERYPLAATLLLRAMIDFTLGRARSSRYGHAARHLAEARSLAARMDAFGDVPTHAAYEQRLHDLHARKTGFWAEVSGAGGR